MTIDRDDPAIARFVSYVDFGDLAGCWEWTAGRFNTGYGSFSFRGQNMPAQRFAWLAFVGPILEGSSVLHRCDNRGCVKPMHLFLGDARTNSLDRWAKGRKGAVGRKPEERAHLRLLEANRWQVPA